MLLHKGETLFRQGETGPLYRIRSGLLKIVRIHEDGHPVLVNIIVPGETIPHHSLISPKEYYGTAIALMTCEIETLPAQEWYAKLQREPQMCLEIAMLLESKLRMMQQRIDQLTQIAPSDKLAKLQTWFEAYIAPARLTDLLTQEEIGQFIGLRRETVNRLLRAQAGNRAALQVQDDSKRQR
ncbi:Crp/Fnr family transcriptional regulator [Paenibacillus elgii]